MIDKNINNNKINLNMNDDLCKVCGKVADDITTKFVGNDAYHLACFDCSKCDQFLSGPIFTSPEDGKLLCTACNTKQQVIYLYLIYIYIYIYIYILHVHNLDCQIEGR